MVYNIKIRKGFLKTDGHIQEGNCGVNFTQAIVGKPYITDIVGCTKPQIQEISHWIQTNQEQFNSTARNMGSYLVENRKIIGKSAGLIASSVVIPLL